MDISELPPNAFINPHGENRREIERFFIQGLELVLANSTSASERSPLPEENFDENLSAIAYSPVSESELFENLRQILAGSMNAANPGYIGHMDTHPTTASILGDFAAAVINNNMLSLEMSPVLSRLENALLREIAHLFGFDENSSGILLAGGTLANLQALAAARNAKFGSLEKGIFNLEKQPVLFASEAAHVSIEKAAMLLGLGTSAVIKIATNQNSQMDTKDLKNKIQDSVSSGKAPFCIVATAGTTVTGSIDPLAEIARIARENNLWFHVDAAYGGALVFSEKYKNKLMGIEYADSITFNPQKWLYVAKTCAMVLFRDSRILQNSFRITAPYMLQTENFTNIGEISVQGTHHADVLKLWLSLQHIGKRGYETLIEESYKLTKYFVEQVSQRNYLQLSGEPETSIVCFRFAPRDSEQSQLDDLNLRLQKFLLRKGGAFLSLPVYKSGRWLRAVLLNAFTDEKIIKSLFSSIDRFARDDLREQS